MTDLYFCGFALRVRERVFTKKKEKKKGAKMSFFASLCEVKNVCVFVHRREAMGRGQWRVQHLPKNLSLLFLFLHQTYDVQR